MFGRPVLWGLQAATLGARAVVGLRASAARRPPPPVPGAKMRVLLVAQYPGRFAGTKYRLAKWGDRLRAAGHEVRLALPMPDRHSVRLSNDWSLRARTEFHLRLLAARTRTVWRAEGYDVAVIHMNSMPFWEYGDPFIAMALKRMVGRVLLDLDDLPVFAGEDEVRPRVRTLASVVDGLLVGNGQILKHLPERPAWFVPTCIDPQEWPVPDRSSRRGPPILGWVGTAGNLAHLRPLAPALAEVCRRHGATVRVISSEPPDLPGVPVEFVRWSAEREVEDLLPIDVGLAPLSDGPRQRCKCGLKALQYMAAGIPVVAGPVGALREIVEDTGAGFLASTTVEWVAALDALLGDPVRRREMGASGRRRVEERYSFAANHAEFLAALWGRPANAAVAG